MVESRRKPLVLASTEALVNSFLNSSKPVDEDAEGSLRIAPYPSATNVQITAGILRFSIDATILVKNSDSKISRIGQAVTLDPPNADENLLDNGSLCSQPPRTMISY